MNQQLSKHDEHPPGQVEGPELVSAPPLSVELDAESDEEEGGSHGGVPRIFPVQAVDTVAEPRGGRKPSRKRKEPDRPAPDEGPGRFDRVPFLMFYRDRRMELAYLVSSFRGHYTSTVVAILGGIAYAMAGIQQGNVGTNGVWVSLAEVVTGGILVLLGLITLSIQVFYRVPPPGSAESSRESEKESISSSTYSVTRSRRGEEERSRSGASGRSTGEESDEKPETTNPIDEDPDESRKTSSSRSHPLDYFSPVEVRKTRILEFFAYLTYAVVCEGVFQGYNQLTLCWRRDSERLRPTIAWAGCTKGIYNWTIVFQAYPILFVDLPRSAFALVMVVLIPVLQFLGQFVSTEDNPLPIRDTALAVRIIVSIFLTAYFAGLLYIREVTRRQRYETYVLLTERRMELLQRRRQVDGLMELLMPQSVVKKLLRKEAAMDVGHRCLVLVTQVHDFMSWSYSMLPALVVQAIDVVYSEFDLRVSREFGLTKVKAIGDSYICVSGLGSSSDDFTEDGRVQLNGNGSLNGPAARSTNTVASNDSSHLGDVRTPLTSKKQLDIAAPIRFALFQIRTAQNVRNGPMAATPSPLSNLAFKAGLACSRCVGFLAVTGRSLWYEVAGLAVEVALAVASTAPRDTLLVTPQVRASCESQLSSSAAEPASSMFLARVHFQEGPLAYYRGGILSSETSSVQLLSRPVPVATTDHPTSSAHEVRRGNDSSCSTAAENVPPPLAEQVEAELQAAIEDEPQEQEPSSPHTERIMAQQPASASIRSVGPVVQESASTDPTDNSIGAMPHHSASNPSTEPPLTPLSILPKRRSVDTAPAPLRWEAPEAQQLPKQKKSVTDRRLVFLILAEEAEQRKLAENSENKGSAPVQNSLDRGDVRSQGTDSVSNGTGNLAVSHNPNSEGKAMAVMESELSRQEQILTIQRNGNAINDPKTFSGMLFRRFPSRNVEEMYWAQVSREALEANKLLYWPFLMALSSLFLIILVLDGSIYPVPMAMFAADLTLITSYLILSLRWSPPRQLDVAVVVCFHIITFTAMNASYESVFTSQVTWVQVVLTIVSVFTSRRSSWLVAAGQSLYLGVAPILYEHFTLGPVVASTWIASPVCAILSIRFAYVSEVTRRRMFIDELLDALLFKEASEEVKLQRRLLEMVVPPEVVDLVAQKVAGERSPIIETMSDVCLGLLRFDDLFAEASTAVVINPFAAMTAVEYRTKMVERFCYPRAGKDKGGKEEHRGSTYRGLSTIYSVGDRMLIGGPIFGDRHRPRPMHGSAMVTSKLCVGRDADAPVSRGVIDGTRPPGQALGSRLAAEDALLNSALLLLRLVRHLDSLSGGSSPSCQGPGTGTPTQSSFGFAQLSTESRTPSDDHDDGVGRFTALLDCGTAFAAIIGSQQPTFTLLGPATRRVECIMSAAEPGFKGMTQPYASLVGGGRRKNVALNPNPLLDEPTVALPTSPAAAAALPCLWKVKGVGLVSVQPLPFR